MNLRRAIANAFDVRISPMSIQIFYILEQLTFHYGLNSWSFENETCQAFKFECHQLRITISLDHKWSISTLLFTPLE
jgi:hypothetical protein